MAPHHLHLLVVVVQGNFTLWLGRSENTPRGVQESVGGYATLPQVYAGRLSEEKVQHGVTVDVSSFTFTFT